MSYFTDLVDGTLRNQQADELRQKEEKRDFYNKAIWDPSTSDEVKNYAQDQYFKLLEPGARKKAQEVHGIIGKIKDAFTGGPKTTAGQPDAASTTAAPPTPAVAPQFAQGAADRQGVPTVTQPAAQEAQPIQARAAFNAGPPPAAAPPVPTAQAALHFFDTPAARQRQIAAEKGEYDAWLERGKGVLGPDASPRDLAEFAGSKGQRLPPINLAAVARAPVKLDLKDGTQIQALRGKDGKYYDLQNNLLDTDSIDKESLKPVNTQLVWFSYPDDKPGDAPHAVRVDPRPGGRSVDASTGKPIPEGANQVNTAVLEAKIRQNTYGQMGNLTRALIGQGYPEAQAQQLAGQQVEQEFQKKMSLLGAESVHEALGQDPEGNQIAVPLQRTPVPNAIAPLPPPNGGAPSGGQSASPATTPAKPPAAANGVPLAVNPAVRPALAPRLLPGVTPAQAKQAAQYSVPITESVVQMFGDPKQPDLKSLMSYAKIADDPAAANRVGTAIRMTLGAFGDSIGEASVGGGAGPIHLSSGGFGDWLQNKLGIPGAVAQQQAQQIQDVMQKMTPEEREAYDATMAEMSVMAGLRSISKSSAAVSSIKLIENEIPKLGINTADSRQFVDQLQKVARSINNAVTTPGMFPKVAKGGKQVPVGISQEMLDRIQGLPTELEKLKQAKGPAKAPSAKGGNVVDDLVKKYGGR